MWYRKMMCLLILLLCLPQVVVVAAKEDPEIELKQLTLVPASEPVPAMKVRLLPGVLDQKIGNAALFYQAAAAQCPDMEEDDLQVKVKAWRDMKVADWPLAEVEEVLAKFKMAFHQVHLAAQRSRCEWEMPIEDGFAMQLPSMGQYRNIASALVLRIRLQIHQKDYESALQLVREGLAMGRSVAEGATLIQDLVGVAISAMLFNELEALMEAPGSPNLYWALTSLPRPFIDMRTALEYEQQILFMEFPVLAKLEDVVWTPDQAKREVTALSTKARSLDMVDEMPFDSILPMAWVMLHYTDAKVFLADQGMATAKIEALPAAQAVLIYQVRQYLEMRDAIFKWFNLPFAQAYPQLVAAEKVMSEHMGKRGLKANIFLSLLPALYHINYLQTRFDRHVALLCTIESLRCYAAKHNNEFPESLAAVKTLPIPNDPMTGQAFIYERRDSSHARLEGAEADVRKSRRPVYELSIQN